MRNKKDLRKISKVNTHKRKNKEKARAALLKAVMETNVGTDSLKISFSNDGGRRARISSAPHRDEYVIRGFFSSSKSGFGFVRPDGQYPEIPLERDVFIPEHKTLGAIDGDTVEAVFHFYKASSGETKTEGRITGIISYGRKTVIGTVKRINSERRGSRRIPDRYVLVPDDSSLNITPEITELSGAVSGDKVEAILARNRGERYVAAEVVRIFGEASSKNANYEAILAECQIPVDFSAAEISEAEALAGTKLTEEGRVRKNDIIFTIDGEGAKDLDDAVSLRKTSSGWLLGVHIADVSYYVREKSLLDRAVMSRGTSVYFTDKVVPMLPTALSNGACSLNAGEDKYALSAIISLDREGNIKNTKIEKTIIRSRIRGVYGEVNRIFDGTADEAIKGKYKDVIPTLNKMNELYLLLDEKARQRGAMELETTEAEIVLDGAGNPVKIVRRERADAEKLIEKFMLTANEGVARLLCEKEIPCVFRVHDNPPQDKLDGFIMYMHNLGFDASVISKDKTEPSDFAALLRAAKDKDLTFPVSYTMVRAMAKAKYSSEKSRHFGLALDCYCHFTSPIRRLSDLATHRIIHKTIFEGKEPGMYAKYAYRAAAAATEAELRAIEAERRIENLYKTVYMSDKIGESFDATVISVASFGFFVELDNTVEGLVPIEELCGYFVYDEKTMTVRSRECAYKIGDRISVRLEEADIIRGKLRFSVN